MPELAEVEYYRTRWNPGLRQPITAVHLHGAKRVFRGQDPTAIEKALRGARLLGSQAGGKQMLFRFSGDAWIGIHLGMTGALRTEPPSFVPQKHDHFVLQQKKQSLVFSDPRQFGRVLFHRGRDEPAWWSGRALDIGAPKFTAAHVAKILDRHSKAPVKAILLDQKSFPGVGNWMADEILWRAGIKPSTLCGKIRNARLKSVWRDTRAVAREALRIIGPDFGDLPRTWLFWERWKKDGKCPKHRLPLERAQVGGRTTAWCPRCQPV